MNSKIAGQLNSIDFDPNFYISQPIDIPYFDNKKLTIGFVEATHQPYLDTADKILENFLQLKSHDKIKDTDLVYVYYDQTLTHGYTKSLDISSPVDIWKFVEPKEIIIYWDEDADFYLCVSCDCAWEDEHGLQLVFKDGLILTRASGHDGHFTD